MDNDASMYGAAIMKSQCESSSDEFRTSPSSCRPSDQANRLGPWVCQQAAVVYTHHRHLLLVSTKADTHYTVPRRIEGWLNYFGTAVRMRSPFQKLNHGDFFDKHTTAHGGIRILRSQISHTTVRHVTTTKQTATSATTTTTIQRTVGLCTGIMQCWT